MNAATEALTELHKRILAEADEQDGHAMGEVLAGNVVKEQAYRSAAAGLRMAAGMVTEELENQKICERIDAMTPAEVEAELLAAGHTKEGLDAGLAKVRAMCEAALAKMPKCGDCGKQCDGRHHQYGYPQCYECHKKDADFDRDCS